MSDDKDRVKQAIDIVSYIQRNGITLKKESRLFVGLCPFHAEKSGSFKVYPETQSFHCFGCHIDGDIFTFAMKRNNWTFPEALEELAREANITLISHDSETAKKRERLYDLLATAADCWHDTLMCPIGMNGLSYVSQKRQITHDILVMARIGFAPDKSHWMRECLGKRGFTEKEMLEAGILGKADDGRIYERFRNRIMIPLRDGRGRVVGFVGRAMQDDQQPKYLTGPSTELFQKSDLIYRPTSRVKNDHREAQHTIVVVEGQMDAISALNRGFENVVAQMGSTLTEGQMDLICKNNPSRIVFCLDRDEAGINALRNLTQKHITRLASKGIALHAMFAPHGKDPDDTFREHPELWQPAVDSAQPVVSVLIDLEMAKLGTNPPAAQVSVMINDLLPILKSANPLIEDENIRILSDKTGAAYDRLKNWLAPQMRVMDKPAPAPVIEDTPLPSTEEWVLHGILSHEADGWLARANACLFIASDTPMPYALAPLTASDFTDAKLRRFFEISARAQTEEKMIYTYIDGSLEAVYQRIKGLKAIGEEFGLSFDYDVFIDHVYELRLARLQKEHPNFEGAKAHECANAIACLHLCQEEMI